MMTRALYVLGRRVSKAIRRKEPLMTVERHTVPGLPTQLSADAHSLLFNGGHRFAIGDGTVLSVFEMPSQRPLHCVRLDGSVRALEETTVGLLLGLQQCERWSLSVMTDGAQPLPVFAAQGQLRALAAVGSDVIALTAEPDAMRTRLVRIDLRQRAVTRAVEVDARVNAVAASASTGQILLSTGRRGELLMLDATLATRAATPPDARPSVDPCCTSPRYCCCPRCCAPCVEERGGPGGHTDARHPADDPDPAGPGEPGRQGGHDPARPPGQVGLPADDGGVITADGGRVAHHPPVGTGRHPCGFSLFWEVASLRRYGSHVLALGHGQRQAALFTIQMDLLREWNFGRQAAHFARSADVPALLMLERSAKRWSLTPIDALVPLAPGLDRFPIIAPQTKTFIGQQTYGLSHDKNRPKLPLRTLLLPVMEGDQTFSSADLSGFNAYLTRTMVSYARDYYVENSFGVMSASDIDVTLFGTAGPLKLPRGKLADYYFPVYVPARVQLTRSGLASSTPLVFDGRESLSIQANAATGSLVKGTVTAAFFAIGFVAERDLYPASFKFLGTEQLQLTVTAPTGTAYTLALKFAPRNIDIADDGAVAAKLVELVGYLDDTIKAAEAAAGVPTRLFAPPKVQRVKVSGKEFGKLVVTVAAANQGGTRLQIGSAMANTPGGDPIGLGAPLLGTLIAGDSAALQRYLEHALLLAQDALPPFDYSNRLLLTPACAFDPVSGTLTTTVSIADRYGGIGAAVSVAASSALEALFTATFPLPNSATSFSTSTALRDRPQLYQDALTVALDRQEQEGKPIADLAGYGCVLVLPLEPGTLKPGDDSFPRAGELWNISPLHRPFDFRGAENMTTVEDGKKRVNPATQKVFQIQAGWSLIFMNGGIPDNPMIVHELGHVLNFADLYREPPEYRDDLDYLEDWAMMNNHWAESHHCGYHKLQAQWIPDGVGTDSDYGRVYPIGLPDPPPPGGGGAPKTWELLLVPVELWRDSLVASARAAFGVDAGMPVVQLASVDLGGDGATYVLIEARQPTKRWSTKLPGGGGVIITHGIGWNLDQRFIHANQYRRPLHLLNGKKILRAKNDRFDLATAPELPVKGTVVEVLDVKTVEGDATVYRIKVTRENAEFVDLYLAEGNPYYKSPDLWLDWAGNNGPNETYSDKEADVHQYPLATPTDQGETIRVHPSRDEHHWLVARLRNRGQVKALDVKLDYFFCDPPGGGDRGKNFKLMGSTVVAEVAGGDAPLTKALRWEVPPGASGHTCLLVRIQDYKIPRDSTGAALGSDDVWQVNNSAQKNVDKYEALQVNPYEPIEFDFSVHNEGPVAERAYLEPEHLPFGMTLTVSPPQQKVPAGTTVLFRCKLELDSRVIAAGCRNDQRFRITVWRQEPESAARWGGVEYEIRPRQKTAVQIKGTWDYAQLVEVQGKVTPNPGGGTARLRLDYENNQPRWVRVSVASDGGFALAETAPANARAVEVVAVFDANRLFGSARSVMLPLKAPSVIR
jgi:hypothetical protein